MKRCASNVCSGANEQVDGGLSARKTSQKKRNPLTGGFFFVIFFLTDADNLSPRFTVTKSYTYVIVVNKHRAILWTTDKIVANSMLWSAHNRGAKPCIERGNAGQQAGCFLRVGGYQESAHIE